MFSTHIILAQIPFAPVGARWHYSRYPCDPNDPSVEHYSVWVEGDTIIQGKTCTFVHSDVCPASASCNDDNIVYQEGSKVYIYEPILNGFQMLYDFSLQAGTSYRYKMCNDFWEVDSVTIFVDSADIGLEGFQYLRVVPDQMAWWGELDITIVKGVGGIYENRLLFPVACVFVNEPCTVTFLDCYQTPSGENYPTSCLSSVGDMSTEAWASIYPNPIAANSTVYLKTTLSNKATLTFIDVFGRITMTKTLSPSNEPIEVSLTGFRSGIYYWYIITDNDIKRLVSCNMVITR